jgi:hypothetical protein
MLAHFPTSVVCPFFSWFSPLSLCCFLLPYVVTFFGLLFGALSCLVEDGPFHEIEKDSSSMHRTLSH